jgi:hypothetical protein
LSTQLLLVPSHSIIIPNNPHACPEVDTPTLLNALNQLEDLARQDLHDNATPVHGNRQILMKLAEFRPIATTATAVDVEPLLEAGERGPNAR